MPSEPTTVMINVINKTAKMMCFEIDLFEPCVCHQCAEELGERFQFLHGWLNWEVCFLRNVLYMSLSLEMSLESLFMYVIFFYILKAFLLCEVLLILF